MPSLTLIQGGASRWSPKRSKNANRPELTLMVCNDIARLRLQVTMNLRIPITKNVLHKRDVLHVVREFYGTLPYRWRNRDPMNGALVFDTDAIFKLSSGDYQTSVQVGSMPLQPANMRQVLDTLKRLGTIAGVFHDMWLKGGWDASLNIQLAHDANKPQPQWLKDGCEQAHLKLHVLKPTKADLP